jgi:hypothetical protein
MTWHRNMVLPLLLTAGCGAPLETLTSSEAHGALAGNLRVTVVEEGSGTRLAAARVRVYGGDGGLLGEGTTTGDGTLQMAGAMLTGTLAIEVVAGTAAQRIEGLHSSDVVIAVPALDDPRVPVTGTVTGLPMVAGSSTQVGVGLPVTLLRTLSLEAVAPSPCTTTSEAGSCTFMARIPSTGAFPSAATVSDANGVIAFVFGQVSTSSPRLSEALTPIELSLTLPTDNAGLAGIIGVPGLALEGQLVLLPQAQSTASTLRVPAVIGNAALSLATYWVLVEGHPMRGAELDMRARSVLFRRGLGASGSAAWDAWLGIPEITVDATGVAFDAIEGADVYSVDFVDGAGALLGSTWVLEGTGSVHATRPSSIDEARVARIRVRAIDTVIAPSLSGFEAVVIEQGAQRFSERDWAR